MMERILKNPSANPFHPTNPIPKKRRSMTVAESSFLFARNAVRANPDNK